LALGVLRELAAEAQCFGRWRADQRDLRWREILTCATGHRFAVASEDQGHRLILNAHYPRRLRPLGIADEEPCVHGDQLPHQPPPHRRLIRLNHRPGESMESVLRKLPEVI